MKIHRLGAWALIAGLLPALALAEVRVEERRAMAPDGTVSVSNVAGNIRVNTWDRDEVHLVAELGSNQELEVTETSQGIRFEVVHIEDEDDYDEAYLEVICPEGASIEVSGVSSDVVITDSKGDSVTAESVSGDVAVTAEVGRIELSSVSGDVEFEGAASRAAAESVSGDIDLQGISGEVTISTVSGDAQLVAGRLSRGQFETVSGTLELELSAEDGAKITVESMNGDVVLLLPADQQAQFGAQTFSGDIDSAWGDVKNEKFGPGSHLKHTSGNSGTQIRVESFSGDIHIGHK